MTISPPAKVNLGDYNTADVKILTSGFDRLILAVNVNWSDQSLFEYLKGLKEKAKEEKNMIHK
jgi:hypothetical protein